MRHCALLFAGLAFGRPDYIDLWKTLPADSTVEEVIRNFFIRQPVLWVGPKAVDGKRGQKTTSVEEPGV